MTSGLSHELTEPLSAAADYIPGGVRALEKGDSGPALQAMRRAREQVARAGQIIQGLRSFGQDDGAERRIENLTEVIEGAGARYSSCPENKAVALAVIHAAGPARVLVDRSQLQLVLISLMGNVVDAMAGRQRRELSITTRELPGHMVGILVACAEAGLTAGEEQAPSRCRVATQSTARNTDLGLCRSIIESHAGRLWAENNPAAGVNFHVVLPTIRVRAPPDHR